MKEQGEKKGEGHVLLDSSRPISPKRRVPPKTHRNSHDAGSDNKVQREGNGKT